MSKKTLTEKDKTSAIQTLLKIEGMLDDMLLGSLHGKLLLVDSDRLNLLSVRVGGFRHRIESYPTRTTA